VELRGLEPLTPCLQSRLAPAGDVRERQGASSEAPLHPGWGRSGKAHTTCDLPNSSQLIKSESIRQRSFSNSLVQTAKPSCGRGQSQTRIVTDGVKRASDPLAPLAHDIARALTEPDFALHHCAQSHPLLPAGRRLPGARRP